MPPNGGGGVMEFGPQGQKKFFQDDELYLYVFFVSVVLVFKMKSCFYVFWFYLVFMLFWLFLCCFGYRKLKIIK